MHPTFTFRHVIGLLFPWRNARLVEQAAGEVARQCQSDLWRLVCRHLGRLSIAEIRGYVRARAGDCVEAEVDSVLTRRQLEPSLRARVLASAIDQLILMTVRNLLSQESIAVPQSLAA
jgi:hypothetical protein